MILNSKIRYKRVVTSVTALLLLLLATATLSRPVFASDDTIELPKSELPKSHHLYFSLANEHGSPTTKEKKSFECEDKIYAVIELTNFKLGKHKLSMVWTDPHGTDRERTEYDFHVREQNTRLWSWLSLSRGRGGAMFQWINPAAGLEDFVGPWTVTVRVNNKKIQKEQFEVSC